MPIYAKALLRKGAALLGLQRPREASLALQEGLKIDPFDVEMKACLQEATQKILAEIMEGASAHLVL